MSGLYNLVIADGHEIHRAQILLPLLGFTSTAEVGRFRDCWVENWDGRPVIAVYTRNGGDNRVCYCTDEDDRQPCSGERMTEIISHPLYLRDADDTFDGTYATLYFRVPPEHSARLIKVAQEPVDMSANWLRVITKLNEMRDAQAEGRL